MTNVQFITSENFDGSPLEYVLIDRGNDEYTFMTKAAYEEQQKAAELGGTL